MDPLRRPRADPPPLRLAVPAEPSHPAAVFHVAVHDAFRDKAEREARRRAEKAQRKQPKPAPAAPPPTATAPLTPPSPAPATDSSPVGFPARSAAILPWPVRPQIVLPSRLDAPGTAVPPQAKPVQVKSPDAQVTPTSAAAAFDAAAFWRGKKPGGGSGSGSDGDDKEGFSLDDLAGLLIVLAFILLGVWMLLNLNQQPTAPALPPAQIAAITPPPAPKPDPYPNGPINLKPTSPPPVEERVEIEAAPAPAVAAAPVRLAEAAPAPRSEATALPSAACVPGRLLHAYFCTSHADLTPAAADAIRQEIQAWKSCAGGAEVVVKGYADARGSQELNFSLGTSRARTIAQELRAEGLVKVAFVGVGELDGLEEGNCGNQRRVDIGLRSEIEAATPSRSCARPKEAVRPDCPPPPSNLDVPAAPSPAR